MMETEPFGRTGHQSTRVIFGADEVPATLIEFGVNHLDTAAGYGDSELHADIDRLGMAPLVDGGEVERI